MPPDDEHYSVKLEARALPLFETPVAYCQVEADAAFFTELEDSIRERRKDSAGLQRSNVGGWHSDTDMLDWGGAAARKLAETAVGVARRMSHFQKGDADDYDWFVRMWANITPPSGLNAAHTHPGNLWSAVFYLDLGGAESDDSLGGSLYLEDPRFPMAAMRDANLRLLGSDGRPQQFEMDLKLTRGKLVLFPAWLRHGVRPYIGSSERLSVALNIDAQPRNRTPV